MRDKRTKAPELGGHAGLSNEQRRNPTTRMRPPLKWQRVLGAFLAGRSYNRFEAERDLNDHTLPSTVSSLQEMGVTILRRMETVPGYMGCPTEVMRYWLAPESQQRARVLLDMESPPPVPVGANLGLFDAITGAS